MSLDAIFQVVITLVTSAILGGVSHLWLKTERLDRDHARNAEKVDGISCTLKELKDALSLIAEKTNETSEGLSRIEGKLENGFARGAKARTRR